MKTPKGLKIIEKTAAREGVSVTEVRGKIEIAINAGLSNLDPAVQTYWAAIPKKGTKPTPEEVIIFIVNNLKEETRQSEFQQ